MILLVGVRHGAMTRRGSRSSRARNVPPENSPAINPITVTKTRKPVNDAPRYCENRLGPVRAPPKSFGVNA